MKEPLVSYQTELSANVVMFCRFLRNKGFNLGAAEESDVLKALTYLPIGKEKIFRYTLKTLLVKNRYQSERFNEYYEEFWDQLSKASNSKVKEKRTERNATNDSQKQQAQFEALKDWLNLSPTEDEKAIAAHSHLEVLTKKDFKDLSKEEMLLIMAVLKRLARKVAHEKSRLKKTSRKRKEVDLKRTIRSTMRRGGEIQQILYGEQKEKRLKLVLLCDVSKSMDLYSRFFVHLIYAFQNAHDSIETFVFSTALHRVSEILDNHEFDKAFDTISERVPHWSGGTTIGSCLADFCQEYGYGMLNRKTVVFILSDGWDTGAPEAMRTAMQFIYKRSRKVIWLNPLAGSQNFSPEALGMKTALPYIDTLASAHNLESLKQLIHQIKKRPNLS
ncbi:MAG: VWA domain-containing protein [Flavobacteriaceae bacterium]